jgi:(2Fe-2S) ferredoxin
MIRKLYPEHVARIVQRELKSGKEVSGEMVGKDEKK